MIKKNSFRFYLFSLDSSYYCYDCFTNKIYEVDQVLFEYIKREDIKMIKEKYVFFYKKVILKKEITKRQVLKCNKKSFHDEKCCVTLDFSNNCNMDCKYCYRNKYEKSKLKKEDFDKILDYIKNKYFPSAKEYSFSLGYTSESSLDLDDLIYFDSLIAKNEGYLFEYNDFSLKKLIQIFNYLPKKITQKYSNKNFNNKKSIVLVLNDILCKEKLWNHYNYRQNSYIASLLNFTQTPSLSKTVVINRQILNDNFKKFNIKKNIAYMSMSFMTNGTAVTSKFIDFIKSIYMTEIWVSIDGPKIIHNSSRLLKNGSGSFEKTIEGIELLQRNSILVNASVVINPVFTDLLQITNFLISKNLQKISISLPRGKYLEDNFSKKTIDSILDSIILIYKQIENELKNEENKTLFALKSNAFLYKAKDIVNNKYVASRCYWGKEVVIDANGNWYHCNSTVGNEKDNCGSIKKGVKIQKIKRQKTLLDYERCKNCTVKYLCGGLCYADEINGYKDSQFLECYYRKSMFKNLIIFIAQLKRKNLLSKFIKQL